MHDRDTTAETLLMRDLELNRSLTPPLALEGKHPATSSQSRWAPLQSSASIVFSVLCYAAMAVIAWTATCYLSFKPIGPKHYGVDIPNTDNNGYGSSPQAYHQLYVQSEEWFRAARVLASIVATLTIPVATAVCTRGCSVPPKEAVNAKTNDDAGRQGVDRACDMAEAPYCRGEKNYCLVVSYCRYFLKSACNTGAIIAPLQQLYLSTATIKTPIWPIVMYQIDLMDHFNNQEPSLRSYDFGETTTLLRDRLGSTDTTTPQAQLWSRTTTCNMLLPITSTQGTCITPSEQYTFGNMSQLEDPFLTQLPSGFSTGLIRQFAPCINSTARRENITQEQFPQGCDTLPGAFYVKYENISTLNTFPGFTFKACMPANVRFSEVLYLAVNFTTTGGWRDLQVPTGVYFARVTVNTSAGFFELPNYMNGGVAGPLLAEDPTVRAPGKCDVDCEPQTYPQFRRATPNTNSNEAVFNETYNLQTNPNKGPLLQNALALFGFGSFIDVRTRALQMNSFGMDNATALQAYHSDQCTGGMVPFLPLLHDEFGQEQTVNPVDGCSHLLDSESADSAQLEMIYYLSSFVDNSNQAFTGDLIANAFSAAAFLANQAWMLSSVVEPGFLVNYDLGADMQVPVISLMGIIVVSVVLGLFLLLLLGGAVHVVDTDVDDDARCMKRKREVVVVPEARSCGCCSPGPVAGVGGRCITCGGFRGGGAAGAWDGEEERGEGREVEVSV
ncbi:hypothetical protein B0H16DRAFT_1792651 [Mycena metata]|uniref:Uncharacterized protein n=1 Tax=Mycena metata TaxID=1033252 RepID=A0AAD7HHZ2_9AGAR|nr:hypothetical protein B0H16DRAFT_1792651 [Mycena metata]